MKVGLVPPATPPRICRTSVGAGICLPQISCRTNGLEVPPTSNPFLTPEQYRIPSKHDGEFKSEKQMRASNVLGLGAGCIQRTVRRLNRLAPRLYASLHRSTRWTPLRVRLRPVNR